jgi:hypothetical protein
VTVTTATTKRILFVTARPLLNDVTVAIKLCRSIHLITADKNEDLCALQDWEGALCCKDEIFTHVQTL